MLTDLCQELHNWFDLNRYEGTFTISDGVLTADFLLNGQYYRIIGSVFNDGVHQYGEYSDTLQDETFKGAVWALGIPKAVVELSDQIDAWIAKYYASVDSSALSPFQSESFAGYSYSKGSGGSATSGSSPNGWKAVFASNLNRWRKI